MEEQASARDPLIGAQVGNYTVREKLGEGGMGAVYMAEHPLIGKKVALKVLHHEFSSNEDVVGRFFNEAKAVNDIGHPNIVDIIDYGVIPQTAQSSQVVYFIMEFLDGRALADVVRDESPLAPERALGVGMQVADALASSHRSNIVHRDLKPDNIILIKRRRESDFVKVLDFGIAKLTGDQPGSRRTRTGIVMGTPAYMSPEQCEGKGQVDHRTDVYALGVVLYEMLTGRTPFVGQGYGEILVQHLTQPPAPPSTVRGGIPPHVELVCLKALEKSPDARFQTMDDFMAAMQDPVAFVEANGGLEGFLSASLHAPIKTPPPGTMYPGASSIAPLTPVPGHHSQPTPAPVNPGARRWPLLLAALLVAVGATVGVVVALGGGGDDEAEQVDEVALVDDAPEVVEEPVEAVADPVEAVAEPPEVAPEPRLVTISVASRPSADVWVGGEKKGKTPFDLEVEASDEPLEITLRRDGYQDRSESIVPDANNKLSYKLDKVAPRRTRSRTSRRRARETTSKTADKTQKKSTTPDRTRARKAGDNTLRPDL